MGEARIITRLSRATRVLRRINNSFGPGFFWRNRNFLIKRIANRLLQRESLIDYPRVIGIGVCDDCNLNCLYCFEHSPRQPGNQTQPGYIFKSRLKVDIFKKLVDDLAIFGDNRMRFVGRGESFLHPNFIEMCRYVINKGLSCEITSNGSLITKDDAKAMVDLGINKLDISIGAANPSTYHAITGAEPHVLDQIFEMLGVIADYKKNNRKEKPIILVTNVICSINFLEIVDMVKRGLEAGVNMVGFHRMYFCKRRKGLIGDLLLDEKQVTILRELIVDAALLAKRHKLETNLAFFLNLLSREGVRKTMDHKRQSRFVKRGGIIYADGSFYPWHYPESIGNIYNSSFFDIWYSERYIWLRNNASRLGWEDELFPCSAYCRCCSRPLYERKF